jgi:regulator of protease activity HflC (stomatin/prohibitin superfamily)
VAFIKRNTSGGYNKGYFEGFTRKGYSLITGGVVGFILLIILLASMQTVATGHVGIVTRYGRVLGEQQSGFHFIPPWEHMTAMNVQVQKSQVPAAAATKDLQQVSTTFALNYNLTDGTANQVYKEVGVNYVSNIIDPVVQEEFKAVTAKYNATDLITERAAVQAQTFKDLQAKLENHGITVDNVNIVNFDFSPQFSAAIEHKQVAAQNVLTQQYNLQSAQLQSQAQEKQKTSLSAAYLQLQAIQKWDGKLPNTLAGGGSVFNIPLTGN